LRLALAAILLALAAVGLSSLRDDDDCSMYEGSRIDHVLWPPGPRCVSGSGEERYGNAGGFLAGAAFVLRRRSRVLLAERGRLRARASRLRRAG
jgi:hypothetical protein